MEYISSDFYEIQNHFIQQELKLVTLPEEKKELSALLLTTKRCYLLSLIGETQYELNRHQLTIRRLKGLQRVATTVFMDRVPVGNILRMSYIREVELIKKIKTLYTRLLTIDMKIKINNTR